MKLSCAQSKLNKGLTLAGRLVGTRTTLPILNNILLEASKGRLIITSTDLEIGITAIIGAKIIKEGKITIPSRLLCDFVAVSNDKKINLSLKNKTLTLKSKHSLAHIKGMSAEEFPLIPKVKGKEVLVLNSDDFLKAINQVIIAAATDDTRPVLCGVYFKIENKKLKLVATDSYRLAEKNINIKNEPEQDNNFIVPLKTMQELVRIISTLEPGDISIKLNESQISFNLLGVEIISRLVEGEFPEYEQIIPKEHKTRASLRSQDFNRTLKMVGLFAQDSGSGIELNFDNKGEVRVLATSNQVGDNKSKINSLVVGDNNKIAFNAKFITDVLSVLGDKDIDFEMTGKFSPGVLKSKEDKDFLYVIMPLKTEE